MKMKVLFIVCFLVMFGALGYIGGTTLNAEPVAFAEDKTVYTASNNNLVAGNYYIIDIRSFTSSGEPCMYIALGLMGQKSIETRRYCVEVVGQERMLKWGVLTEGDVIKYKDMDSFSVMPSYLDNYKLDEEYDIENYNFDKKDDSSKKQKWKIDPSYD